MTNQLNQSNREWEECESKVLASASGERLSKKFVLRADHDLSLLVIDEFVSQRDIDDLFQLHSDYRPCRRQLLEGYGLAHPKAVVLTSEYIVSLDQLLLMVIERKVTIGEANQQYLKMQAAYQRQWQEAMAEVSGQLTASHAQEMQQRQRAGAALSQWAYQQQLLIDAGQARGGTFTITNCDYVGTSLRCTSY